jgi:hypothetical protein
MSLVLLLWLLGPTKPSSAAAEDPRAELEGVKQILYARVQQVSRTSAAHPLGLGETCRAYHVRGLGAFFVLAPRVLPVEVTRRVMILEGPLLPPGAGETAPPAPSEFAARMKAMQERRRAAAQREVDQNEAEISALEEQVREFQKEAQQAHEEAEQALEHQLQQIQRIQEVNERASTPGTAPVRVAPPTPPSAPLPAPPPAPPWEGWFLGEERRDPRSPDAILRDVQSAVTLALEASVGRLESVGPEESVIVAVDFYAPGAFSLPLPPVRTLVVRARKKDLAEGASGKIPPEELKKRIEYLQY